MWGEEVCWEREVCGEREGGVGTKEGRREGDQKACLKKKMNDAYRHELEKSAYN